MLIKEDCVIMLCKCKNRKGLHKHMGKMKNKKETKVTNVSEDTLEFLSLDDETIEEYMKKSKPARSLKKLSVHKKDRKLKKQDVYEEEDWDDDDDEDEDEDFETEELEEIEEDDEDEDDEEYYEDDEDEDEEYYEIDDEDEEDDEYYEIDEDEDYEDEDDEDDDEEDGFFARIGSYLANMSSLDHVVLVFGCFIVMAAVATGLLYVGTKMTSKQVEAFAEIGTEIQQIGVIGESGLLAVSNAESARLSQMFYTPEAIEEQEEENAFIEVAMNLTSIQSDIKIKFVNKRTNKLINSIPFEVEVTGDNGKTYSLKDDDKDGIIYQTGVNAGTYTVKAVALTGEEYEKYMMPSPGTITVTDTITYKKVDVADEIKTEAEVNVAVEDTAKQDTAVESSLTDTVEWVESTRTEKDSDNNYQEINKSDIPDPSTLGMTTSFMKLANTGISLLTESETPTNPGGNEGENGGNGEGTTTPGDGDGDNSGNNEGEGSGDNPGENKGEGSGESGGGDNPGGENGDNPGGENGDNSGNTGNTGDTPKEPSDRDKLDKLKPALNKTSLSLNKGASETLSISTTGGESYSVTWSSDNDSIATVDSNGTVTAKGNGTATATITATVSVGDASTKLTCTVTVTTTDKGKLDELKPALNTTSLTLAQGQTTALSISVTGKEPYTVEWSSSDKSIASVDKNGVVKGEKIGDAKVTAKVKVGEAFIDLVCNVKVSDVKYTALKIEGVSALQVGKTGTIKGTTTPTGGKVSWTSDNEKVVKIDENGTMTGVSVGTATITGTCGDAKNTWKVTVTKDVSGDTTTKLKDKNGNQIFVRGADGKYIEATYADYYKDQKLYLRKANASYSYTGWQTIDGSTYFFDKNGNYVTGDQVIQGAKYSFGSDGRLSSGSGVLGIDVSKWNGTIDWNAVKNSGVSYVIIRCGYRGSSTGALIEDPRFKSNIQGAKNAGLKVGVYFFSQAVNEVEAVEEASMALNLVSGYGLNYPIFLDVESSGGRGDKIDAGTRTAVCKAFCSTIQNSGYTAGIYANKTWLTSYINTGSLTGYKIWLAQYASSPSYAVTRHDMWQYSSKGKVSGISGNVDMNISYMNY